MQRMNVSFVFLDAVADGDTDVVERMIHNENYSDLPNCRTRTLVSPLHICASKGFDDICTILLQNKAHIDGIDADGRSPLHYAAAAGNSDTVSLLVDSGAILDVFDVNIPYS
jgi:ankyrin repeat protein